jgi:hypothetical protein
MSDNIEALILDLLEWIGPYGRPYAEVMDAWRTSCPRLPVWEDANQRGYIAHQLDPERGALVAVSTCGRDHLEQRRRLAG